MGTNKGALGLDKGASKYAAELALQDLDELMTYGEVADATNNATITIKKMRERGVGPPFRKTGLRNVLVRRGDLVAWLRMRAARFAHTHPNEHASKTAGRSGP